MQKIDGTILKIYEIVVFTCFILDKDSREKFFEKSFLLANVNSDIVFKILFSIISNTNVDFQGWDFQWKSYTAKKVLLTTRKVKLIGKKEFAIAAFNLDYEVFVVYIATLSISSDIGNEIYSSKRA